jgi:hypothetical protein
MEYCKVSKDVNIDKLPGKMQENNAEIPNDDLPERIAQFLDNKIKLTL